ncbi:MAG: 3-oxoacyl-[acyl-carrier-protein] reductase [Calditrichia bacterium]
MLTGKIALVTGATSGIGNATAKLFLSQNAIVVATGRNLQKLEELKNSANGKPCDIITGDITDKDFRTDLIKKIKNQHGKLDILVNAAGIIASGNIENTELEDFSDMMNLNVTSVFHLMQLSVPLMKKHGGAIVNVSSVTGIRSFPNVLAYGVSKAAVDQLTRSAALELASEGIRVNAVNPGVVVTNLHKRGGMTDEAYRKFLEHSKTTHPLGRVGKPEEVAEAILFLGSEKSSWITGVTLPVDGGRAQTCLR